MDSLKTTVDRVLSLKHSPNILGLNAPAQSFLISKIWKQDKKTTLIITPDDESQELLYKNCQFFIGSELSKHIYTFPAPDTFPYSNLKTQDDIWTDRLKILHLLNNKDPLILISSISAIARKIIPKQNFLDYVREYRKGEEIERDFLLKKISESGYQNVTLVEDRGTFAIRGGIIDIFTPLDEKPLRIEFDGDRIDSIREFNPSTQRSKDEVGKFTLIPAKEVVINEITSIQALSQIKGLADNCNMLPALRRQLKEYIQEGIYFTGCETTLPIFYKNTDTIFDYIPKNALVVCTDTYSIENNILTEINKVKELYRECKDVEKIVPPEMLYLSYDEIRSKINSYQHVNFNQIDIYNQNEAAAQDTINFSIEGNSDIKTLIEKEKKHQDSLKPLTEKINEWLENNFKIIFTCHTKVQADRMLDLFRWHGLPIEALDVDIDNILEMQQRKIRIKIGPLTSGFRWHDEGIIFITDEEIFGKKISKPPPTQTQEFLTNFSELNDGDLLVHLKHGIGRYLGLKNMDIHGTKNDYIAIEYLGGDKLYLPVYKLNIVQKYVGPSDDVSMLDKLGGTRWDKAQKKASKAIKAMAQELLNIYAKRAVSQGLKFPAPDRYYEEFEASFPYDETEDQMRAINDVAADMGLERPMDRLICGDVGYGKTEIAMRAGFRSAMFGKQTLVLVPTTILAFQHYDNFTKRFKDYPVKIEMLTRFKTRTEQKKILWQLEQGTVDIVIGTHRLLQKDVKVRNLGLLVVDEEQRFGVAHKEKIKKIRSNVDVLTLSATPIPRTLHMALMGLRDISIINTPPSNRLSIRTFVAAFDEKVIREAILREVKRGGQVFFLHNRVETIHGMKDRLNNIVPEAKIGVAHGQLKAHELEDVMIKFLSHEFDVLLCTTIIESGIDIPNANTLIVNRADTFGLAQLYQLRGRVGRSNQRAFSYFLIPDEEGISDIAKRRLTTLQRYTELGSGFQIASHDLEIRGSGNILGAEQSGHVAAIGYEMFDKLLQREIRKLQGKKELEEIDPELNLNVTAFIPTDYIENNNMRMDLYKRLSNTENTDQLSNIETEMKDRFGELPDIVTKLLKIVNIKTLAKNLRILTMNYDQNIFSYEFDESTPVKPGIIMDMISKNPMAVTLKPNNKLIVQDKADSEEEILSKAEGFLNTLTRLCEV